MVLIVVASGGAGTGAPAAPVAGAVSTVRVPERLAHAPRRRGGERGSQTLELALAVPVLVLLLVLLVQAAVLGVDLLVAHGLAREAARAAAVGAETAARDAVAAAAGRRSVDLRLSPPADRRRPGDLVTAEVRLRSEAFAAVGVRPWLVARATTMVEDP